MSMLVVLKSVCRRGALLLLLAALLGGILLCASLGDATEIPRCGVALRGADAAAATLGDALIDDGLTPYASEAALRDAMARGEIPMGVVLPDDLDARLAAEDTRGVLLFLDTPNTVFAPLWRLRIAARLIEMYAPTLVSDKLVDAGVSRTPAEMREAIDAYLAADAPFRFTYETVAGAPVAAEGLGIRAVRGYISLLFLCLFGFFACPFTGETLRRLSGRLGARQTLTRLLLPGALAVLFFTLAVTAAALALADTCFGAGVLQLFPAAAYYAVFLSGAGLLLASLPGDAVQKALFWSMLSLLSIAFCPIFFDLPALLGFAWVKFLLPPSFFAFAVAGGIFPAAVALAVWLLGLGCCARINPYKLKKTECC